MLEKFFGKRTIEVVDEEDSTNAVYRLKVDELVVDAKTPRSNFQYSVQIVMSNWGLIIISTFYGLCSLHFGAKIMYKTADYEYQQLSFFNFIASCGG